MTYTDQPSCLVRINKNRKQNITFDEKKTSKQKTLEYLVNPLTVLKNSLDKLYDELIDLEKVAQKRL